VNLIHNFNNCFPIAVCNGWCGLGESNSDTPKFHIKSFDSKTSHSFSPLHYLKLDELQSEFDFPTVLSSNDTPSSDEFSENIERFKADVTLEKIVLAKKRSLTLSKTLTPSEILSTLLKHFPKKNIFLYSENGEEIFFGVSPESLFQRNNREITVDCVAGTLPYDKREGLFTSKFVNEHKFVIDYVEKKLAHLCFETHTTSLSTKKAGHLAHLFCQVQGSLHKEITDENIIQSLHPTPAVLGTPSDKAKDFLKENETFDRKYYAGTLGWMEEENTHLKVALRCGALRNNELTLYAGAGITKDSEAEKELTEINQKFNTLEEVFFETAAKN